MTRCSPATVAAYTRDWALFTDFAAAAGSSSLLAGPDLVAEFCAAAGSMASRRRRSAAISWARQQAGFPAPIRRSVIRPHPAAFWSDELLDEALQRLPLYGWPAGIFGRRDAVLLICRYRAHLSFRQIVELDCHDIVIVGDGALSIAGQVMPRHADPRCCPACCWLRWLVILQHRWTPVPVLRAQFQAAPPSLWEHRCATTVSTSADGPALLPIDRWGATPLLRRTMTTRAITAVSAAHRKGSPPARIIEPLSAKDSKQLRRGESAPCAEPPVLRPSSEVYSRGVQARKEAVGSADAALTGLVDIDVPIADLNKRIDQLLRNARPECSNAGASDR